MQASESVLKHAGGAWDASLNHYSAGGNCMVTTQQIDEWVYVVGQDDFLVVRYSLDEWLGEANQTASQDLESETAEEAWELLRLLREDCFLWQCEACESWLFTSNRPRVGVLRCSTCRDGGINFWHADRHVNDTSD